MDDQRLIERLADQVGRLEAAYDETRATHRRGFMVAGGITVAILCVTGWFLYSSYSFFEREWTEERFAKHIRLELEELQPSVTSEMQRVSSELVPVFTAELRRQVPERLPEISDKVREQFDRFGQAFRTELDSQLEESMQRVESRIQQDLAACYPSLSGGSAQQRVHDEFHRAIEKSVRTATHKFQSDFGRDVARLQQAVDDFPPPKPGTKPVDLQKRFIRLWLKLLDEEIEKL